MPVTLELGGKSPMIVMDDADLEQAVNGAVTGVRFTLAGPELYGSQPYSCASLIVNEFVESLVSKVNQMVIGDPLDEKTDIGTIVSPNQFERVQYYLDSRLKPMAQHFIGVCQMPTEERFSEGLFVQPAIITGLTNEHRACREEIFGPVTAILTFDTLDEALEIANDTEYGLAATIWTKNLNAAMRGVHELEAGFVQVNQNLVVQPMLPYGGYKTSGLARKHSQMRCWNTLRIERPCSSIWISSLDVERKRSAGALRTADLCPLKDA